MIIHKFRAGPLDTNGYLTVNSKNECLIIDPSLNSNNLILFIKENKLTPLAIILTHGHFDHYLGIFECFEQLNDLPLYFHPDEEKLIRDCDANGSRSLLSIAKSFEGDFLPIKEGDFEISDFKFKVFHIPGHTPGGIALYDSENCFVGDSLFAGSIGRTDFYYGNHEQLIDGITKKLMTLPDDTKVLSGHGWDSTIGIEKSDNPYLR